MHVNVVCIGGNDGDGKEERPKQRWNLLRFITLGCCEAQAERRRKRATTHKIGEYEKKTNVGGQVREKDVNKSNNKEGRVAIKHQSGEERKQ